MNCEKSVPPLRFNVLVPVWGERYIDRFSQLCLRSLLTPGNLHWLSSNHSVTVTVLTAKKDWDYAQLTAALIEISCIADINFIEIDDLINTYGRNYSSILTRAYCRAMSLESDITNTNFIFLVGDLVFSDKALQEVASAMQSGHDACLMCSPRVDAGALAPILEQIGDETSLCLSNRQIADYLMAFPHPTLAAKIVRRDTINLSIAHQFFWRPDTDTMVARCYLLHMLCIRPTCRPADVPAPCDFAFVAEFAPNGRYHYLTDSDRFIAIEVQDTMHEVNFISTHPLTTGDVAESLSAWTTPQHRMFSGETFVFKSRSSCMTEEAGRELTDPWIRDVAVRLGEPLEHRHHIFWLGTVGAQRLRREDLISNRADGGASAIPTQLARLILENEVRMGGRPVEFAIIVNDRDNEVALSLASSANLLIKAPLPRFYEVMEDVAIAGGSMLLVLQGNLHDFLQLFNKPNNLARLYSLAGINRTILLCYRVEPSELQAGRPSRAHLFDLFASGYGGLARYGLVARVIDLSASPLDEVEGFIIEITSDELLDGSAALVGEGRHSLLFGDRRN